MDRKEEYIRKLDTQLREWSSKIDELKARAVKARGDLSVEYKKQIETLDEKKETAQKKLKELGSASGQALEELKTGAEKAWRELKTSLDSAIAKFRQH